MARRRRWWWGRGRQGGKEEGEEEQELPVPTNVLPHRLALFAKSLREIEALRAEQNHLVGAFLSTFQFALLARPMFIFSFLPLPLSVWCMRISAHSVSSSHPCTLLPSLLSSSLPQLKQEFHVDALPPGATDPSLFPILNTKVQHLCLRFPVQAEEIAQKNGFETAEFNSLLLKTEKNPFFRWRVERLMEAET